MNIDKKIPEYRSSDWSTFRVKEPKDTPQGPHFAGIVFEEHYEDSGYSVAEGGGPYRVPHVEYFAFVEKVDLDRWLTSAIQSNKNFFFFRVAKIGTVSVQVNVGTEI